MKGVKNNFKLRKYIDDVVQMNIDIKLRGVKE